MNRLHLTCLGLVLCGLASDVVIARASVKTDRSSLSLGPLLAYLRCESPVPRDPFDQAARPKVLDSLPESMFTGTAPSGAPTLPLEVWKGTVAQIEVLAGYGYFGLIQHYSKKSKATLLKRIAEAGWVMNRSTLAAQETDLQSKLPRADLVGVHTAESKDNDLPRTIMLIEAKQTFLGGKSIDTNGVTVVCTYSKPGK